MVSDLDSEAWSNLVLPLAWHRLSVGTRNLDASVEAALVVSVSNGPPKSHISSNRAVVGTLVSRVAMIWPSVRFQRKTVLFLKQCVFLFNTKPRLFMLTRIEYRLSIIAEV